MCLLMQIPYKIVKKLGIDSQSGCTKKKNKTHPPTQKFGQEPHS